MLERKRGRLPAPHRAFCESILHGVENGKSIAASLDDCPASISDLEKSILDAGERGGLLELFENAMRAAMERSKELAG